MFINFEVPVHLRGNGTSSLVEQQSQDVHWRCEAVAARVGGVNQIHGSAVVKIRGVEGPATHRICGYSPRLTCCVHTSKPNLVALFHETNCCRANSSGAHTLHKLAAENSLWEPMGSLAHR